MFCPTCGARSSAGARRCGACGGDLVRAAAGLDERAPATAPSGARPAAAATASRAPGTVLGVAPPAPGAVAPPTTPSPVHDDSPVSDTLARPSWGEGLDLLSGRSTTPDRGPRSPRHELARLVGSEGLTLCADPARVERLLRADWQRSVTLLVAAQRFGVPQELLRAVETGEVAERIDYLVGQLVQVQGLDTGDARWAVESWGLAVGVLAP